MALATRQAIVRPQASFLLSADPAVVQEFAKIAVGVAGGKTSGRSKGFASAANKLQVSVEAVEQGVLMLADILVKAVRSNLHSQDFLPWLEALGFKEGPRLALAHTLRDRLAEIKHAIIHPLLSMPSYHKLDWRLDVQVASRSLRNQASPSFLLKLMLHPEHMVGSIEERSKLKQGCKAIYLEADYITLKSVCKELERALAESQSMHSRAFVRWFK